MLLLKIIAGERRIVNSVRNPAKYSQKITIKTKIEGLEQNFEIKLDEQINPIATPITVLYSNGIPKKRFLPLNEEDIARYQIIRIMIEQFGIQKYFPKIETGYICLHNGIANGIFEDLVLFNPKRDMRNSETIHSNLAGLAEKYSKCLPLNIVPNGKIESEVFNNIDIYEWQMFLIMIPLMGLWDVAFHNIMLQFNTQDLHFVHIDFGDVPLTPTRKKRTLIINPQLLEYFHTKKSKIHENVKIFINNLDPTKVIQKVNELLATKLEKPATIRASNASNARYPALKRTVTIPKKSPAEKVWKNLWAEGKNIEDTLRKMKELVVSEELFKPFFEKLL